MALPIFDLSGKVALVTGGGTGLGKAMALGLAGAGADLILASRTLARLQGAKAEVEALGRHALALPLDVAKPEEADACVSGAVDWQGHLDILVNNAGVAADAFLVEQSPEEWDRVMATNLRGAFLMCRAVGPHMVGRGQGKVINIASVVGLIGMPSLTAYSASKGGLIQLTRSLALEWARYSVQVNALCPGYFLTELNRPFLESEAGRRLIQRQIPLRRAGRPEELQGAVVFLASSASDFMTGAVLAVDGGQSAG
ncbi:MAG: SDR family NAD(P)-dependent oxidoreductase [Nitrospinota bacterium]